MDIYEQIVELRRERRRGAVATIVNVRGSIPSFRTAKMLVRDDGSIVGTIGGGCVEADVWQAAREVMESEKPQTLIFDLNQDPRYDTGLVCGGTLEVFIEPVLPQPLLYIFGAGHVSASLSKVAANVGFELIIHDDRTSYATKERFPEAREIHALDFDEAIREIEPNENSYIVIVTRYVGMIGSRRKVIEIFKTLQKEGLPEHLFDRVHAPIGFDIGAITPEEIAVAITAELISIRRHAAGNLPHMSWFRSRNSQPETDDPAPAVDEHE
jgi:xanthine dehydrogenase accessory factor